MSKSWFGRLAAKVSGDKDASPSPARQSAPGSQRTSAPASSGPSRAASATPSQQQRRAEPQEELWEEPPFEAFVAQPQPPPAATAAPATADGETARSPFHASAVAAASAGLTSPERVIDETTDLSTLTDQEITRLMEGMDGDVMNKQ
ncbi:uncharacterized protein LOC62_04G005900 [Vanrija pseudolonga]|uniref:Uncharacterized protein n=1 Tax=Vanrija pseudolonga TaxID=143232 RepID=A0AAF0YDC7_9TREE|nr:hypothetical protein LOC62_04G005900 [Vanrija pseudolonga]